MFQHLRNSRAGDLLFPLCKCTNTTLPTNDKDLTHLFLPLAQFDLVFIIVFAILITAHYRPSSRNVRPHEAVLRSRPFVYARHVIDPGHCPAPVF